MDKPEEDRALELEIDRPYEDKLKESSTKSNENLGDGVTELVLEERSIDLLVFGVGIPIVCCNEEDGGCCNEDCPVMGGLI